MREFHISAQRRYFSSCVYAYIFHSSPTQKPPVQKKPSRFFHSPVWLSPSVKNPAPLLVAKLSGVDAVMTGSHFAAVRSISCLSNPIALENVLDEPGLNVSKGADCAAGAVESTFTTTGLSRSLEIFSTDWMKSLWLRMPG